MRKIKETPLQERPREKLISRGAQALSDVELLCAILGSGTKQHSVQAIAQRIASYLDSKNEKIDLRDLKKIAGVGEVKAIQILAAQEFFRRRIRPEGIRIEKPADILPLITYLASRKQEHFVCISISGASEVIASRIVSVGLLNKAQIHPREVFADAITDRAAAIIVAHNHPSGNVQPSEADRSVTAILRSSGEMLGIPLLDHIIFDRSGYYSFLEHDWS